MRSALLLPLATVLMLGAATLEGRTMSGDPIRVESRGIAVELDPTTGAVLRIAGDRDEPEVVCPPGLADSFRLVVRAPDGSLATIRGRDQGPVKASESAGKLRLTWGAPLRDTDAKPHDIMVEMQVRLVGGSAEFRLSVHNGSPGTVTEVWYPFIGDLAAFGDPADAAETVIMAPTPSPWMKKAELPFGDQAFAYPGQMNMSFASIYNATADRAVYFASHDEVARYKLYRFLEQRSGEAAGIFASVQHCPYLREGESFTGSTVVVRFHRGDWHAAGAIYREWFTRTFGLMDPSRCWIRRQTFFQDTMFLLPEGNINYTFKDIPQWAKDAVDHGVRSLMISGWHRGGHDNGYPHYEPDPRLGTYEDLRQGIDACHELGAKVYFFVNYQPAMIESEWYKQELHQYAEMREDGSPTVLAGWGMGTLWARMGHPKLMAWVDPSFPAYQRELTRQFAKLVDIGADGLHVDKMYPSAFNHNPRCRIGPDTSTWEGSVRLSEALLKECREINPDFALSFECNWDRMLQFTDAVWWVGNMSVVRSVFPEMVETLSITSPYDYLGVNNAVRLGHAVLLGPLNYSRSIGWEPWQGLADYIKEVKGIQDSLADTVFLGEVLGKQGVELTSDPGPGIEYNVFRNLRNGRHACVITNGDPTDVKQGIRSLGRHSTGRVRIHTPFREPVESRLPVEVTVPGERIVFVEEL